MYVTPTLTIAQEGEARDDGSNESPNIRRVLKQLRLLQ